MHSLILVFLGTLFLNPAYSAERCERASDSANVTYLRNLIEKQRADKSEHYYDYMARTSRRLETKVDYERAKVLYGNCISEVSSSLREILNDPKEPQANRVWTRILEQKKENVAGTPFEQGGLTTMKLKSPVTKEDFRALLEFLTIRLTAACQGLNPGDRPILAVLGRGDFEKAKAELHEAVYQFNQLSCEKSALSTDFDSVEEPEGDAASVK